jgi:hypothetical protein
MRNCRGILAAALAALGALLTGPALGPARAGPIFTNTSQHSFVPGGAFTTPGPPGVHAINTVDATPVGSNLVFQVTFHNMITDPSQGGSPNDLFGFIDIQTDGHLAVPLADLSGQRGVDGFPGLNVNYYVDFGSVISPQGGGSVDVLDVGNGFTPLPASISFASQAVTVTVPFSSLGGSNGLVHYGVIAVDGGPPGGSPFVSDLSNDGSPAFDVPAAATVPEPGSATLLCLGLAAAWGRRWLRRLRRKY